MGLIDRALSIFQPTRSQWPTISWDDYASLVNFGGNTYLAGALQQTIKGQAEDIGTGFDALVQQAFRSNAVVFACELARLQLFSEARFQYQRLRNGRPAELFGDSSLSILEHPWPTAITGDLLTRALLDADFGGTAFNARRGNTIRRLRPDWVTMILGSDNDPDVQAGDIDADVLGIAYYPGGKNSGRPPEFLLREEISIFAPIPDPLASYRGMPWIVPVIREIMADKQMTDHKSAYLVNGATPNLTVAIDKDLKEAANPAAFSEWVEAFKKTNPTANQWERYKTWYLAGGTTVTRVGSNMQEIDFKQVQGAGETRIAAAAGVPPVIVGLSEGLQAATYSNYGQARRRFADNTMRPLWRNMAGSLETIVPPPAGARLWYDDRDIQALAEDKKDLAEVRTLESQQIRTLLDAGWEPDSVIDAVTGGDMTRLKGNHTGLFSVQLQPAGKLAPPTEMVPAEMVPAKMPPRFDELMDALLRYAERPPADVRLSIDAGAIVVNTPDIRFEEGAFRVEPLSIEPGAIVVHPSSVVFEMGAIAAPDINVTSPPVQIINADSVDMDSAQVAATIAAEMRDIFDRPLIREVERDENGRPIRVIEHRSTDATDVPDADPLDLPELPSGGPPPDAEAGPDAPPHLPEVAGPDGAAGAGGDVGQGGGERT
jgi:hypothetical protein